MYCICRKNRTKGASDGQLSGGMKKWGCVRTPPPEEEILNLDKGECWVGGDYGMKRGWGPYAQGVFVFK